MERYWIAVASKNHVLNGVRGGFAQVHHGKRAALERMKPGDWIAYYSPKLDYPDGAPCQAFTAIGQIMDREVYQFEMTPDFRPYRRDVRFLQAAQDAPIRPLLERLSFIRDPKRWSAPFRFGHLEMTRDDFDQIASGMGLNPESLGV